MSTSWDLPQTISAVGGPARAAMRCFFLFGRTRPDPEQPMQELSGNGAVLHVCI